MLSFGNIEKLKRNIEISAFKECDYEIVPPWEDILFYDPLDIYLKACYYSAWHLHANRFDYILYRTPTEVKKIVQ